MYKKIWSKFSCKSKYFKKILLNEKIKNQNILEIGTGNLALANSLF